jgi:hypothetical protein
MKRLPLKNGCKLLFRKGDCTNYPKSYFTFNTKQEYDAFVEKLKQEGDCPYVYRVFFDEDIICEPEVSVSDGFACYGGKTLKAKGCRKCWIGGSCTTNEYFIDPTTIEEYHDNPTKHYWV